MRTALALALLVLSFGALAEGRRGLQQVQAVDLAGNPVGGASTSAVVGTATTPAPAAGGSRQAIADQLSAGNTVATIAAAAAGRTSATVPAEPATAAGGVRQALADQLSAGSGPVSSSSSVAATVSGSSTTRSGAATTVVSVGADGRLVVLEASGADNSVAATLPTGGSASAATVSAVGSLEITTPETAPAPYEAIPGRDATRGFTGVFPGITYTTNGTSYVQHIIGQGLDFQVLTVQFDSTTTDFAQIATSDIGYAYVRGLKCTGPGEGLFRVQPAAVGTDLSVALQAPGGFCIKFKVLNADTFITTFSVAPDFQDLVCPGKFETQQSITSAPAPVFGYNVFKRAQSATFPDC